MIPEKKTKEPKSKKSPSKENRPEIQKPPEQEVTQTQKSPEIIQDTKENTVKVLGKEASKIEQSNKTNIVNEEE